MVPFITRRVFFAAAFFCSPFATAHGIVNLEEWVVVEGRRVDLVGRAASASQGVVGQEEIELRPLSRTGEVLETIPGMVVTQHSGSGKANQYFLRGFNLDHGTDFSTIVDGMPVNMRSHGHGQGYSDLNFIIPETIHNIQYQKGSYYADVGDFSGAGSANMQLANLAPARTLEMIAGQNNYQRLLVLDSHEFDKRSVLYAVEWNGYDGPWKDINEDVKKLNGVLKLNRDMGTYDWNLSVMAYQNHWNSADQIPARAVAEKIIDELGSLDKTLGGESSRYSINSAWNIDNFSANIYAIRYGLNLWSNFTHFLDDEINGDQFEQTDERTLYGGRMNYQWQQTLGIATLEHKLGGELRVDDIAEVGLYKSRERERLGTVRSDAVDEASAGMFWQTQLEFNAKWRAIIGARYDYYDFSVAPLNTLNSYGVDLSANAGSAEDGIGSLNGSLIYSVKKGLETYFSAGQGFHSNDARGVTIAINPVDGQSVAGVDPLVRSLGYELGTRAFISDSINTSVALWQLDVDSELVFVGDAGTTEASRASNRRGVEWTGYYRINKAWNFDFEYAYTDAQFKDSSVEGKEIPGALKQVMQAGLSARVDKYWLAALRLRYFGKRPLVEDNSVQSQASTVVNMRLGYDNWNWGINLDVLNLLDSNRHDIDYFYASRLASDPVGEGIDNLHYHVLEPRSLRLAFNYHF